MSVSRYVIQKEDNFDKDLVLSTSIPYGEFGWLLYKTAAGGSPTAQTISSDDGCMQFTLASTSEVEVLTMCQGDILPFRADHLQFAEFLVSVPSVTSNTTLGFGFASGHNATLTSLTDRALFVMNGGTSTSNVVIQTADGSTTNSNIATGATLSSVYKKFVLDFTRGLKDVRFFIDGAPVAQSTTFNMNNLAGSGNDLQLYFQLQKASSADTPQANLARVKIQYRKAAGQ